MSNLRQAGESAVTALMRVSACVVGLTVLLALPCLATHHFGDLYRTTEVRQTTARHTFLAEFGGDTADLSGNREAEPRDREPVPQASPCREAPNLEAPPAVPITRLLRRRKIGLARAASPDPLL
jgi:hypothetical protein